MGCCVMHGVDARDLKSTLHANRLFDYVVFNFPCIATEVDGAAFLKSQGYKPTVTQTAEVLDA